MRCLSQPGVEQHLAIASHCSHLSADFAGRRQESFAFKNFPKAKKFEKGMNAKVIEKRKMHLSPFLAGERERPSLHTAFPWPFAAFH